MGSRELHDLAEMVSPIVEEMTGYEVPLSELEFGTLPRQNVWTLYSELQDDRGGFAEPRTRLGRAKKEFDKQLYFCSIAGFYTMKDRQIFVVPENYECEGRGMAQIVAHELTHAVQFIMHPEFVDRREELKAPYFKEYADKISRDDEYYVGAQMLLEGQARAVEKRVRQEFGGDWWSPGIAPIVEGKHAKEYKQFRKLRSLWYSEGALVVNERYFNGGIEAVEELFSLSPEKLWGKMNTVHMLLQMAAVESGWNISRVKF